MEKVIKAKNQDIKWDDCVLCYVCECGEDIVITVQNDPEKCPKCGRVYSLCVYVEEHIKVKEKK